MRCIADISIAKRNGHGRNADYSAPPAQIPACAANALGSSLGYERQIGSRDEDVIVGFSGSSGL